MRRLRRRCVGRPIFSAVSSGAGLLLLWAALVVFVLKPDAEAQLPGLGPAGDVEVVPGFGGAVPVECVRHGRGAG